jgi:hypothetical protein
MAWTSAHFAVGMACSGAATAGVCLIVHRGWRWLPAVMTLGGLWACVPDMPRLWREDFPGLPLGSILGQISLEHRLHEFGNLFFFHARMDAPPHLPYALNGLIAIICMYNASIAMLMWMEHRQRNSLGNRHWRAHGPHMQQHRSRSSAYSRHSGSSAPAPGSTPAPSVTHQFPVELPSGGTPSATPGPVVSGPARTARDDADEAPVVHRIRPDPFNRTA